jgi:hypothetical protein
LVTPRSTGTLGGSAAKKFTNLSLSLPLSAFVSMLRQPKTTADDGKDDGKDKEPRVLKRYSG